MITHRLIGTTAYPNPIVERCASESVVLSRRVASTVTSVKRRRRPISITAVRHTRRYGKISFSSFCGAKRIGSNDTEYSFVHRADFTACRRWCGDCLTAEKKLLVPRTAQMV